jgi:hypothetical protein
MKNQPHILSILYLAVFVSFTSCANNSDQKTPKSKTKIQAIEASKTTSDNLSKEALEKVYSMAINDYIKTVYKKDKMQFDILYFGKHVFGQADDFPDIELPTAIANTQIRLIDPELGLSMQQKNKAMVYINMMGFVDQVNASFILVNFSNGAQHQYDYFIDYDYNRNTKEYCLTKIAMEDYRKLTNNKPKHISLFSDGKYTF